MDDTLTHGEPRRLARAWRTAFPTGRYALWEQAGRPEQYRVDLCDGSGTQHVTSGTGPKTLAWALPPLTVVPRQAS
ncbi:hypothetical protein AB0C52_24655 [Streptomyces sp. NPDC048717]|uniref:hypothetical protein n=1 Tax=Streptomyces sp. NPDC048717 TaxID=3154928 RepID=UPI0034145E95